MTTDETGQENRGGVWSELVGHVGGVDRDAMARKPVPGSLVLKTCNNGLKSLCFFI